MPVIDTSALLQLVASRVTDHRLDARLAGEPVLRVPHLIDVEFLHALRRLLRRGEIDTESAVFARERFGELALARFPHHPLRDRIWQLRENLTAYDAAYVALAEALDVPLVTTDEKLARAPGHTAEIELFSVR